jgi:septal ring factor EnvC (AmiA/AmiB activator)
MLKRTLLATLLLAAASVHAQDIAGLEDCSRASGADRKIGCLQSNVNYLYDLIRKNEAAAQTKLRDAGVQLATANAQLTATKAQLDALRGEIDRLKGRVDQLEKKPAPK